MSAVHVHLLFSFKYGGVTYPCALVEWFKKVGDNPDAQTRMWIVEPELDVNNEQLCSVLHLDSFVRGAHIVPMDLTIFPLIFFMFGLWMLSRFIM